ncbi:MAG: Txe/YoeB family addiction module [Desulfobulbaceae bacterium]|jgi:Txe/YoeB family toxin of toxin-antitoxin system|nr:MAG: Txe/YoeB family addiction module [Desulfobulbaceae bacterium]
MVSWSVILSKQAIKDIEKLKRAGLAQSAKELLFLLAADPFTTLPKYEKLVGNLQGFYSRRINIQHRLVYSIDKESGVIHVLRMWSHYE